MEHGLGAPLPDGLLEFRVEIGVGGGHGPQRKVDNELDGLLAWVLKKQMIADFTDTWLHRRTVISQTTPSQGAEQVLRSDCPYK